MYYVTCYGFFVVHGDDSMYNNSMYKKTIQTKRENAKNKLLNSLTPIIESGEYGGMTIRDICASIGVTTGLFYRHFNSKNEALAAWLVREMREYIDHYTEKNEEGSMEEQILRFCRDVAVISKKGGPEMMTAFMEKGEPQSACSVIRDLFAGQIEKIIAESGRLLSQGRAAESIASDITVIVKGLSYEFYTQGKEYDLVGETERILRMVIPTLL